MQRCAVVVIALGLFGCGPIVLDDTTESSTSTADPTTATSPSTTASPTDPDPDPTTPDPTSPDPTTAVTTDTPQIPPGLCQFACESPSDCCLAFAGDPSCMGMLGTYPYDYECTAGACIINGCLTDQECTFGGVLPNYVCRPVDGFSACFPGCAVDSDCNMPGLEGWRCTGGPADDYCEAPPCASDEDCFGAPYVCNTDTGRCEFQCSNDGDCSGFGVCDPGTGLCGCTGDQECARGSVCDAG